MPPWYRRALIPVAVSRRPRFRPSAPIPLSHFPTSHLQGIFGLSYKLTCQTLYRMRNNETIPKMKDTDPLRPKHLRRRPSARLIFRLVGRGGNESHCEKSGSANGRIGMVEN